MQKRLIPVLILIALLGAIVLSRQPGFTGKVSRTALVMGTVVEITAFGDDENQLERSVTSAFEEMSRLESLLSSHLPDSDISRLTSAQQSLDMKPESIALISRGLQIAEQTNGAFDMTLGRLKKLWNIESENPHIPTASELNRALMGTGIGALSVNGSEVIKHHPDIAVDLGGIAKGYAVDQAVDVLKRSGVTSAAVNAGGDIRLLGDRQGVPWRIGIQHPRRTGELLTTLSLSGKAVVTSGDYERYFERDGIRYHHIFDPRTGQPARLCQSVTVVAENAALADALATAAFVAGPSDGLTLLETWETVEGLLVSADGHVFKTSGLSE